MPVRHPPHGGQLLDGVAAVLVPALRGLGHFYFEDSTFVRDLVTVAGGVGKLRVELEPLVPNVRWWGMVSSTNNRSSDVTVVTPN